MRSLLYAAALLVLVAAANIIVAEHGPDVTPYVAFACVGPVLVLRDKLHELWEGHQFALRMGALIAAGGLVAYITTPDAGKIALASLAAFVASLSTDTIAYALLRRAKDHVRVNVSNAVSALVDSYVFLTVAFGSLAFSVVFAQFAAKVAGGALVLALLTGLGLWRRQEGVVTA